MNTKMDHHSWLVENNLLTDKMKDDLATAGYFIVEKVLDVYPSIDFNTKVVEYKLIVPDTLYEDLKLLERFQNGESIGFWKSRRLKKFLEKKRLNDDSGMGYQLELIANGFVKNYLNDNWRAEVKVFKEEKRNEIENFIMRGSGDSSTN
jgi:hypothetical protein